MNIKYLRTRKWRAINVTNFLSALLPSIYVCRLCGLIPNKICNGRIEKSKVAEVYCTIVIVFYLIMSLIHLYVINASPYINRESTWKLQGNCYFALVNFILLSNYVFGSSIIKILQGLMDTTRKLPAMKFSIVSKWIFFKDLTMCLLFAIHFPKLFTGNPFGIFTKFVGTYASFANFILDFQYCNYVMIIGACFKYINEELVKLKDSVLTERAHLLRRVYHIQFNPLLFVKLRYLKQWHYELNEIIRRINCTFSLQIVATIVTTFTELTFGLYFFFLEVRGKHIKILDNEIWYYYSYTSVIYFTSKLLLLALTCQHANDENDETSTIINEIIISTDDKLFKEELHLFSLQLLHSNNIFIAKGVQVDATLLTSMSKGIFTYLLILIQFSVVKK